MSNLYSNELQESAQDKAKTNNIPLIDPHNRTVTGICSACGAELYESSCKSCNNTGTISNRLFG